MSSRALRKAQKERERMEAERRLQEEYKEDSEGDLDSPTTTAKSPFAMLGEAEDGDQPSGEDDDSLLATYQQQNTDGHKSSGQDEQMGSTPKTNAKRKRKNKKRKVTPSLSKESVNDSISGMDDIDQALKSLSTPSKSQDQLPEHQSVAYEERIAPLLATNTQSLEVSNETRRLFGKAALSVDHEDEPQRNSRMQRIAQGEQVGLADAVRGEFSPFGYGLPAMVRRRNMFIQGKEGWPRAPGGGLGMEVEKRQGGITTFRFTHNKVYQQAQKEFDMCVLSMDPSLMVNLLRFNPYHISSLLQVSEIAKHERDYATAGDLLERALFSFGRVGHSTFASALGQGKARLDFRRPENREFWLAGWRYLHNLGMRATWRTAYEWAKLLFSLDPIDDPYAMKLILDQLALRARQPQQLLDMLEQDVLGFWQALPNLAYSKSLAFRMTGSGDASGQTLKTAVQKFPWVAARLFQEAGIDQIPPTVWGKQASGEIDPLHCELYVSNSIDLWKTPENMDFLRDVVGEVKDGESSSGDETSVTAENVARHVVLTDKPALIGLLPERYTSMIESSSDPYPPDNEVKSYETGVSEAGHDWAALRSPGGPPTDEMIRLEPEQFIRELYLVQTFFERLIPGFLDPVEDDTGNEEGQHRRGRLPRHVTDEAVDQAINHSSLAISEVRARLLRLVALREALIEQEGQVVRSEEGSEARIVDDGRAQITFATEGERPSRLPYLQETLEPALNNDDAEDRSHGQEAEGREGTG